MKQQARNALIALLALMFILSITRLAKAVGPSINLPPGTVNATFNYPGSNSYWSTTLSNVPSGYDVTNAIYVGWCCDETFTINNGATLGVKLYSSYDPLDPYTHNVDPGDWNKVNYIINNKQGTADDVQAAIWHYIDSNGGNQADPDVIAMEADADANGGSFVPTPGQLLAVVLYKEGSQTTFIEVIVPAQNVQLTTTSAYDSPTPTSGSYTPGTSITASVTPIVAGPAGTQYVCTGWTGTGSVVSGTGTSVTFTITQDSSITWNWKTQYLFTVASAHDTPAPLAVGSYWIDSGNLVSESVTTPADQVGLMRYRCIGYTGTGDLAGGGLTSSVSFHITQPTSVTFNWVAQYYLTVKTDPPGVATLAGEGWYDASATPTLTAPLVSGKYNFTCWYVDGVYQGTANVITVPMSAPRTAIAYYWNAVGGEWAPISTVRLVTPWIALALLAVATAGAASHRLFKKHW